MGDTVSRQARRRFLKFATAGVAAAPFCAAGLPALPMRRIRWRRTRSLPSRSATGTTPRTWIRTEWPDYEEGETCANCQLYHGEEGAETGPCDIFSGNLVSANGWCMSWLEKEA